MSEEITTDDPTEAERRPGHSPRPFLFVVLHRDQPSLGGARYELSGVETIEIGRGSGRQVRRCDGGRRLELELPGRTVSKAHARLVRDRSDVWGIEDLGSRNGCFLNGRRISRGTLRDRDFLAVGSVTLRYRAHLDAPEHAAGELEIAGARTTAPGFETLLPGLACELDMLARIARTTVTTLLLGQTGTGKEVLARGIHQLSGRPGPFVAVNCGALSETLLDSQLFGHIKGAFTGALRDEPGFIRSAHTGTLLLDEIGDLPLPAQAALLRVLQEREVVPVGATRPVSVDLRVLAATHKPLDTMAIRGQFRGDLLARLVGYRHTLPPLCERLEDLGILIRDILARLDVPGAAGCHLGPQVAQSLFTRPWPLNIRQLVQFLTTATALAQGTTIDHMEHLSASALDEAWDVGATADPAPTDPDMLRARLIALLEETRGNVSEVGRRMGKARMQIHRWMRAFGIDPDDYRAR